MQHRPASVTGRLARFAERTDPVRLVLLGYLTYVLIGWALLALPWSRGATGSVAALDHLFMATSAVSTTGLTTVSTADTYSFFGELILLALIQLGGLGYMTLGSFAVLAWTGRLSPLRERIGGAVFALPPSFEMRGFLRLLFAYTFAIELAGAIALYAAVFEPAQVPDAVWQSLFHSVSAFCTAGFGLFNDSFESFRGHVPLNLILLALSYLGAIGFIVVHDFWHAITHRQARVTLTTKIILVSTTVLSVGGTLLFYFDEPSLRALPPVERWLASWFQVATASTTVGFNTLPIGQLSASSLVLLCVVMIIGASPAGTGGGLKTTTFTALWAVMMATIRRRPAPTFLGREIPVARIRVAVAGTLFYAITLTVGIYALSLSETAPLADQVFECVSALGTVGLSCGLTAALSASGKAILIALMFIGRTGPLVFAMALFRSPATGGDTSPPEAEDVIL